MKVKLIPKSDYGKALLSSIRFLHGNWDERWNIVIESHVGSSDQAKYFVRPSCYLSTDDSFSRWVHSVNDPHFSIEMRKSTGKTEG